MILMERLLEKLENLTESFRQLAEHEDLGSLEELLVQLEGVVRCPVCQEIYRRTGWSYPREMLLDELQTQAIGAFSRLEKSYANKLGQSAAEVKRYLGEVSDFTREEMLAARIGPKSRVLFIGCGSVPVSPVTVALEGKCQVTAVDSDAEASALATMMVAKLGLQNQISVSQQDGRALWAGGYTHIILASLVCCKHRVLRNLERSVSPGTRLLLRYGNGLHRLINGELSDTPIYPWRVLDWINQPNHIHDTLLLRYEHNPKTYG